MTVLFRYRRMSITKALQTEIAKWVLMLHPSPLLSAGDVILCLQHWSNFLSMNQLLLNYFIHFCLQRK